MTVVNPKSISGINSITTGSGSDNLLTIHTSDASSTERVRINSSGDVIVGSGITVSPDGDIFATGVTTATTFVGAVTGNVTGNISGGTVAGSTGTFSGAVSGTTGTFSGAVSGTTGTFSAAVSGTTGTFTGDVDIADKIIHTGDTNTAIRFPSADTITAETGGTERLRINSTGQTIVGDSVTQLTTSSERPFQVHSINGPKIAIGRNDTSISDGNTIGGIEFYGNDANGTFVNTASIIVDADGAHGDNDKPTRMLFYTTADGGSSATERVRIDSAGRVGIKNTNMSSFNTGMDDLVIGNGVSNTSPGMTIFSHATDIGTISFRDSADTGISGLIQYRHLESPPYMKFMVEGTQRMSITTHGGIAFNSDTAAANTLDDYEEGSWTPTFNSNSNGGTFPVSTYIRIGRLVSISFHATVGGGNDTSGFKVFGLPFSPDKNGVAPVSTNCNIPCHCRIFDSSNRMEVHKFDSSDVTYQNLSDKFIMINATYRCNP